LTTLAFLIPGPLDQLTGGYLFDRHVVDGLRESGRTVSVVELPGRFPDADAVTRTAAGAALAALPAGSVAVIDGLALPAFENDLAIHTRRLRVVGFVHHPLSQETGLSPEASARYATLESRLWRLLRGVICPSRSTAEAVNAAGVAADRIAVAPPGTDRPTGARRPQASTAVRLLCVAAVTPRKGHRLLVEALTPLRDLAWTLVCAGSLSRDPVEAAALHDAIVAGGVESRVKLVGELPPASLALEYAGADAFVLPSFHEGYGMAYAEALAHGLPIIATKAGAIPETVPPEAALFVEPGDVQALRTALRRVIEDDGLRAQLAARAHEAGALLPDWRTAVARWGAALDALVR